ncbi:MAG: hypothetical protein ACOCVH_01805 [Verrucomicrobiota bacterium]
MAELRWTQQASDDLEAITEFIANDSAYKEQLNHECTPVCVRTRTGRRIDTNK